MNYLWSPYIYSLWPKTERFLGKNTVVQKGSFLALPSYRLNLHSQGGNINLAKNHISLEENEWQNVSAFLPVMLCISHKKPMQFLFVLFLEK
jgi:hypothetical protein